MIRPSLIAVALVSIFALTGCNLFGGIDAPSGDEQILSAARAAFDQGDYQLALQLYGQLSSADSDIGLSESAYTALTQAGASMKNYAGAFGKGDSAIGPAITTFAISILTSPGGAGQTTRVAIWEAFNQQANIQDTNLKALVRFLGSISFAAELIAETSADGQTITKADLDDGKVNISTIPFPAAAAPNGGQLGGTFPTPSAPSTGAATLADVNVSAATYNMFNSALLEILSDVTKLSATGTFGNSTLSFGSTITGQFATPPGSTSQATLNTLTAAYATILSTAPVSIGN